MKNSEQPAFYNSDGLTKREYIATMALQGLLSNSHDVYVEMKRNTIAFHAICLADELLNQLEQTNQK